VVYLSGWGDLNSRPSVPQIDAPQTAGLRKHPETVSGLLLIMSRFRHFNSSGVWELN